MSNSLPESPQSPAPFPLNSIDQFLPPDLQGESSLSENDKLESLRYLVEVDHWMVADAGETSDKRLVVLRGGGNRYATLCPPEVVMGRYLTFIRIGKKAQIMSTLEGLEPGSPGFARFPSPLKPHPYITATNYVLHELADDGRWHAVEYDGNRIRHQDE